MVPFLVRRSFIVFVNVPAVKVAAKMSYLTGAGGKTPYETLDVRRVRPRR